MSSAAKLRHFGKGTAAVATAALVMTAFGPTAFASWDDDPNTPAPTVEGWPTAGPGVFTGLNNYGTIGIVDTGVPKVATDSSISGTYPDQFDTDTTLDAAPTSQAGEDADENQGATLVWAGKTGQAIADVRLTLPNRFASGDVVDLILTDRSSTENSNGNTNADAGRAVGFSSDPTVSVDNDPKIGNKGGLGWAVDTGVANPGVAGVDDTLYPLGTQVSADTDAVTDAASNPVKVSNTETGAASWAPHRDSAALPGDDATQRAIKERQRTKPGNAPTFNVELGADAGAQGKNRIRLIAKNAASGDPDAMWVVTLKDLKVDLGANVTPGALRLTPYATSFISGSNSAPSPWFANNHKENVGSLIPAGARGYGDNLAEANEREIGIYTVPAYVSPVTISVDNLGIIADQSPQPLGDITLAETAPYSLGNGQYAMTIDGAVANSTDTSSVKIAVKDGGASETVTVDSITNAPAGAADSVTVLFTLANTDLTKTASYVVSGMNIQTRSNTPRGLTVSLNGGTINAANNLGGPYWLTPAGLSTLKIDATPSYHGVEQDEAFVGAGEENRAEPAKMDTVTTWSLNLSNPSAGVTVTPATVAGLTVQPLGSSPLTLSVDRQSDGSIGAGDITITGMPAGFTSNAASVSADPNTPTTVTFTSTAEGSTFRVTIPGAEDASADPTDHTVQYANTPQAADVLTAPEDNRGDGVNQLDIMADGPINELKLKGSAAASVAAIGGNNRYETARKIAKEWSPLGDEVILASGQNYPDALSSGFLSQRLGAPIILTMQNSVPADTMESIRERGVRKVYIIGGEAAISQGVADKLMNTPSYMWSDSAKNLVPRGGNLEVVRLGGSSRYSTNALVNMYAAALNTGIPVVGTTSPSFGSPNKATAMIARGDNFADALTANVLTSGRNTGLFDAVDGGVTTTYSFTSSPPNLQLSQADFAKLGTGQFYVRVQASQLIISREATGPDVVAKAGAVGSASVFALDADPGNQITFNIPVKDGENFVIGASTTSGTYVPRLENLNALPVILTPQGELGEQAKDELRTLHIGHALIVGGAEVIPDSVVQHVDSLNITTRRLGGTDRYDTARVVNEYAWTPATPSSTNTTPGLGFDGGVTTVEGTRYGLAESFLANGLKFPDALVAGPWVSRRHDAMVLGWVDSLPEPTKQFLNDNAARLDRAVGLGLGAAISTKVIEEANRLVAAK